MEVRTSPGYLLPERCASLPLTVSSVKPLPSIYAITANKVHSYSSFSSYGIKLGIKVGANLPSSDVPAVLQ